MRRDDIRVHVIGKWRGILASLGLPDDVLKDKHGPCPMCGGTDRFRWDNKDGRGTYYCNQCGSGDGWDLLMGFREWKFAQAADAVREVCGRAAPDPVRTQRTDEKKREDIRKLWKQSTPVTKGNLVDRYLNTRGVSEAVYPRSLRFCERCWFEEKIYYPAMLALVEDADGNPVTLHRTWLAHDGSGKAPVDEPRRIMPATVPAGSAIRLGEAGEVLGVAEGIETALCAMSRFEIPVWSCISSSIMSKWEPPPGVEEVVIFADNDRKFGGQAAAYNLAHRLSVKGLRVSVKVPKLMGSDWADTGAAE